MVVDGTLQERAAGRARGQEPNGSSEDQEEGKVEEEEEGLVAGDEEEEEAKVVEEDDKDETEARKEPRPPAPHSSSATATGRLFIRNLAYTVNESDLSDLFSPHGDLLEVHLVLDRETKKSKGMAYCLFSTPESAQDAKEALDSTIFQGRLLHILDAEMPRKVKGKDGEGEGEGEEGGKTVGQGFRAEKAAKRQASAGEKVTWNSLFMRPDTIAEAIAALYKVSKAELLDRSASDLPVRMALGEAQVAQQTKKELAALGVDVGKLEEAARAAGKGSGSNSNSNGMARSPNVLLVKNLPFR